MSLITGIQEYCTKDGPGIRTTVFFKGCSLKCGWCHNPEAIHFSNEIAYYSRKCIRCGKCGQVCPQHLLSEGPGVPGSLCSLCGLCVKHCPTGALRLVAQEYSVETLCSRILADRVFFEVSGGGVTFSGGEPLLQDDLPAILKTMHNNGIHTAVETALNVPLERLKIIIDNVDLFLVDIKMVDTELHRFYTGVDTNTIHSNIRYLTQTESKICFRTPVIPGVNDNVKAMNEIEEFITSLPHFERYNIELIPFHNYCVPKYESLGLKYQFASCDNLTERDLESLKKQFKTIKVY